MSLPVAAAVWAAIVALAALDGIWRGFSGPRFAVALGVFTMVAGIVLALSQDDLKRLFAYSSVSQIGYVLAGVGLLAYDAKRESAKPEFAPLDLVTSR